MAQRHMIAFTGRGDTVLRNIRRDVTGEPLLILDKDEIQKVELDFASFVNSGETVSSATATAESCTVATAVATPRVTLTVSAATSDTDGKITVKVTFSSTEVWRGIIRVRRARRFGDPDVITDYA